VDQCTYHITPSKIEIYLHKAMNGLKWPALEGDHVETNEGSKRLDSTSTPAVTPLVEDTTPAKAPAYPTSPRKGVKDWDAVAKEALKKEKKAEGKEVDDAGLDGDDDDDEEGDPLNGFFKKLYKDANPDTRRAMMKSYIESNGTALSTNWEDVSRKTFPVEPPEGIEAKKWES
jgi:suppressor of G2 allele of SKP1